MIKKIFTTYLVSWLYPRKEIYITSCFNLEYQTRQTAQFYKDHQSDPFNLSMTNICQRTFAYFFIKINFLLKSVLNDQTK